MVPLREEGTCPDQEGKQKMLTPVDSLQDQGSRLFLLFLILSLGSYQQLKLSTES